MRGNLPLFGVTFAFLDVETTGLSPYQGHRICEVAVVRADLETVEEVFASLVNPGRPISPGAAAVNGLSDEDVRDAPPFRMVSDRVLATVGDAVLVCHNAPFDLAFLSTEMERAGRAFRPGEAVDTLAIARRCYRFGSNGLASVARALRVPTPNAHRALGDAMTTRHVLKRFAEDLAGRGVRTFEDLLGAQGGGFVGLVPADAGDPPLPPELAEALETGKRVFLAYVEASGTRTERWVTPSEVTRFGRTSYLVGFCHLRDAERHFRLDRIVTMKIERR